MNVNLHIKELTLAGVDISVNQHSSLPSTIAVELTRMIKCIGHSSCSTQDAAMARAPTSYAPLFEDIPSQIGHQIAQSVCARLGDE